MRNRSRVVAGAGLALVSAACLVVVAVAFLRSPTGQKVDAAVLRGAEIGRGHLLEGALAVLGLVSMLGLAVATCTVAVIAFSRRRMDLALASVVLVGGANVTTQVLKHGLHRPAMGIATHTVNSLPSGHSTVAASLAVALILVVPIRLRGTVALAGVAATTLTGVATLAAGWHRPSDVVAALLVVGAWLGVVTIGLGLVRRRGDRSVRRQRPLNSLSPPAVLLVVGALVALAVTAVALWETIGLGVIPRDRGHLLLAYGGGAAAIAGFGGLLLAAALVVAPDDERVPSARTQRVLT